MSDWRGVAEPVRTVTLTASTTCDHCAQPVPINGPVEVLHCGHCFKDTPIRHFYEIICFAAAGAKVGGAYEYAWFDDPSPECVRCGKAVGVASHLSREGGTTVIPCASCGADLPTFPAPSWLKEHLPTVLQVFGGDAETAKEQGGVDLRVDEQATKPIAMACPSCGGGLTFGQGSERTVPCKFCSASVFIPDALWKLLHPVKTMLRWTLTYTGKLTTPKLVLWEKGPARLFAHEPPHASPQKAQGGSPPVAAPAEPSAMERLGRWFGRHTRRRP